MNFLPEGYETLKTEKKYMRPAQLKDGENRIRIVCRPIAGWIDWKDKKPYRYRPSAKPKFSFDPKEPLSAFWALYVWDYARADLFVLEVTQASIIRALQAYGSDADWGDFTKYDIKIRKQGTLKDTQYFVTPMPHKPMSDEIKTAMAMSPVRLEALYDGGDPWTDLDSSQPTAPPAPAATVLSEEQCAMLDSFLVDDPQASKMLMDRFRIESVYHITRENFGQVYNWLRGRKEGRDGQMQSA